MPGKLQAGSISRTLLLPLEHQGTIRLRYQLAEDGCKESQVALAKSLLTSPISSNDERNANAQLAVYWLLRAANQGQEEAIDLLKDCANDGVGVNTRNSFEIEKCLNFSDNDILSRRIAFSLFHAIMSDTEDVLSEETFREKIEKILSEDNDQMSLKEDIPKVPEKQTPKQPEDVNIQSQPHVTFSSVVNSVQTCLEGNVPLVSLKHVAELEQTKWLIFKYISIVGNLIVTATEDFIRSFSSLSVLVAVLLLCIITGFFYNFSTPGTDIHAFLYTSNLNLATLMCLLTMLSSSCFVLYISFGVENMKKWLHLIKFFEPNVKSVAVERKYLMKTSYPLFSFFIITFIYLILLPLNQVQSSLTELGVFATILMLFIDRSISYQRYHVNVSLILNGLTCLYKSNILQKVSHHVLNYLNFKIIYEIGRNYYVHLSFISCLALPFVLPYLYVKMALGNERKGWHLVLLPHLMSVTWMNLACFHLAEVDSVNLMLSILTCLFIMIVSRYFGFVITFYLYVLIKVTLATGYLNLQVLLVFPVFVSLYFISVFLVNKFKISHDKKLWSVVITVLVILLSYQAVSPYNTSADDTSDKILPWDKYQTHCHHYAWYRTNPAEVQITCLPFKGKKVSLEGIVTAVEVTRIQNSLEFITSVLPNPIHDWIVCVLGKRYASCDSGNISPAEKEKCLLYETLNITHCHLHNWDEYSYQISVEVSTRASPEVIFHVDHVCSTFVRNLKEGDSLKAVGVLESNVGGLLPKLRLIKAQCSSCYSHVECNTSVSLTQLDYFLSLKNIVWFYLSPFIQYNS